MCHPRLPSGALAHARAEHDAFWATFWNASAIDITGGNSTAHPESTQLEQWYYGMQYSFGANTRQGKVAPSLYGESSIAYIGLP